MRINVAIARELGCGGSYIGRRLADELGYRCVDREVVSRTAAEFDLNETEVEDREETVRSFWERMLIGFSYGPPEGPPLQAPVSPTDRQLFERETEVMKEIADSEDCVLVGRGSSQTLPRHPGLVTLYLHAPRAYRVRIYCERKGVIEAQAQATIDRSDEMRRRFLLEMTGIDWSCARYYHLAMDTSTVPWDDCAALAAHYVRRRLAAAAAPASVSSLPVSMPVLVPPATNIP